jgi:acylpyruvate hydrolase
MPKVYGRWGDGYNPTSLTPVPLKPEGVRGRSMQLSVDGFGKVEASTSQIRILAPRVLSMISTQITLFPGDVITFGRVAERLTIPRDQAIPPGTRLRASVEGIGEINCELIDHRRINEGD